MTPRLKLTWADLLIEDVSDSDFSRWIAEWDGFVDGSASLAFLNKFGVWFLRRPEGTVDMLDVFTGEVEQVAPSFEAFEAQVNERPWQEAYLASKTVCELHLHGIIPGPGECYSVAPHPAFGGPNPMAGEAVDPKRVMVVTVLVWQSLCAQSLRMTRQG